MVDWTKAAADGVTSAYIRATMGGAGVDDRFNTYYDDALLAGVLLGFYHLFRSDASGLQQAQHAIATTAGYYVDYPLALDVEKASGDITIPPHEYAHQLAIFIDYYRSATGKSPVIYTSKSAWYEMTGDACDELFSDCALWTANYTTAPEPLIPPCWDTWWLWQYTSDGHIDGFPGRTDLNRLKP